MSVLRKDNQASRQTAFPDERTMVTVDMARHPIQSFPLPSFRRRVVIIAGGYGVGKSEVAVNLAQHLLTVDSSPVMLADLDLVNPYFRSREAAEELRNLGITPLIPKGGQFYADLPIVLPEIKGAMERTDGRLILDVGGDDVGARVLASLADAINIDQTEMLFVLNSSRPFCRTVDECRKLLAEIEQSAALSFTGIVNNTHMMEDTRAQMILDSHHLCRQFAEMASLPIRFVSCESAFVDQLSGDEIDVPVLPLNRMLLKPWEQKTRSGRSR